MRLVAGRAGLTSTCPAVRSPKRSTRPLLLRESPAAQDDAAVEDTAEDTAADHDTGEKVTGTIVVTCR